MGLDLTTLLIWGLRIVLPILFFAIYFRLQAPKEPKYTGPTTNVHSRDKLVFLRDAVKGSPAPDSMKNISLKDQTQAPHLFAGGGRGPRPERGNRRVPADGEQRVPKEKREKKEKKEEPTVEDKTLSDEKMHLESLLNYVAFNRMEQRGFLAADGEEPPAPANTKVDDDAKANSGAISGDNAEKANDEAQMVLKGAIIAGRADVAKHLYEKLIEAHVEISETTFELLIDVHLSAKDLKGASDFLMKLETAGFSPNSELLDKVLELYSTKQSEEKSTKADTTAEVAALNQDLLSEAINQAAAEDQATAETSPMMAPAEYYAPAMMPMFNWDAIDDSDESGDEPEPTKLSSDAKVFVPSFIPDAEGSTKSKELSATAAAFEPQTNMTWDPAMYTWTSWDQPTGDFPDKGKTKGKGNGKGKWKSNDWNDSWKKTEWDDSWKASSGKGELRHRGEREKAGEDQQEDDKKTQSKKESWKKPAQMTWKPKADSP